VAFRLVGSIEQQQQTLAYLEWREKQYDKRVHADIYTRSSSSSSSSKGDTPVVRGALVYIATEGPQNVNWLGPAPLADIARQAAAAVGPSGPNYEYVFRLADAMRRVSKQLVLQLS
jgi:cation transport regulator ChaC